MHSRPTTVMLWLKSIQVTVDSQSMTSINSLPHYVGIFFLASKSRIYFSPCRSKLVLVVFPWLRERSRSGILRLLRVRHKTCYLCLSPLDCILLDHSFCKFSNHAVRNPRHMGRNPYILWSNTPPELPADSYHQLPAILNIQPNRSFGWPMFSPYILLQLCGRPLNERFPAKPQSTHRTMSDNKLLFKSLHFGVVYFVAVDDQNADQC